MNQSAAKFSCKSFIVLASACLLLAGCASDGSKSTEPYQGYYSSSYGRSAESSQGVYFIEPANNATVGQEFKVVMGVKGMAIKPAGDMTPNTGHHHLLIDEAPVEAGAVIPSSPTYLHFGKGQTETTVKLPPGKHTLMLQFANGAHQSYGAKMRASITVEVK